MPVALNPVNLLMVGAGAVLGAWLRWWLGLRFNTLWPTLPLGTLAANLFGGYVIGVAMAAVVASSLSMPARLFIMTGFCGGLTTFSTFSAETVGFITAARWSAAALMIGTHVVGSLLATLAGIASFKALRGG